MDGPQKQDITTDHERSGVKISNNKRSANRNKMHGQQQNLQKMMMKIGQVMIVKMPFSQDQGRAIVKVKAVPIRRPMLSPRQSTRDITGRENKKKMQKRQQQNWKSNKPKKKLPQRLCLPQGILFNQQLQQQQPVLLQLVNLLQQIPAQSEAHLIEYMCTMRGRVGKGGHKEL
jgi:hypothetical protein